jgi:hypothetical protein
VASLPELRTLFAAVVAEAQHYVDQVGVPQ